MSGLLCALVGDAGDAVESVLPPAPTTSPYEALRSYLEANSLEARLYDGTNPTALTVGRDGSGGSPAVGGVVGRMLDIGVPGGAHASSASDTRRPVFQGDRLQFVRDPDVSSNRDSMLMPAWDLTQRTTGLSWIKDRPATTTQTLFANNHYWLKAYLSGELRIRGSATGTEYTVPGLSSAQPRTLIITSETGGSLHYYLDGAATGVEGSGWVAGGGTDRGLGDRVGAATNPYDGSIYRKAEIAGILSAQGIALLQAWLTEDSAIVAPPPVEPPPPPPPPAVGLPTPLVERTVSNTTQLQNEINAASAGTHIILNPGTYGAFTVPSGKNGTATNPIVIRAATAHNVSITGVQSTLAGTHCWLWQLKFVGGNVSISNHDNRVMRCIFDNPRGRDAFITVSSGDRVHIGYNYAFDYGDLGNNFGRGISFRASDSSSAPRNGRVYRNHLLRNRGEGASIGFGHHKGTTDFVMGALAEYNLIEDMRGQGIYCKCSGNTIQFNTARQLTYTNRGGFQSRHGFNNKFIGNSSFKAGGCQMRGKGHQVIGNYKDNQRNGDLDRHGANAGNGLQDNFKGGSFSHPAGENCLFSGNIGGLCLGGAYSGHTVAARNNTIENHTGDVRLKSGLHTGTVDNRNGPSSVPVPGYVVLFPADVGPGAP